MQRPIIWILVVLSCLLAIAIGLVCLSQTEYYFDIHTGKCKVTKRVLWVTVYESTYNTWIADHITSAEPSDFVIYTHVGPCRLYTESFPLAQVIAPLGIVGRRLDELGVGTRAKSNVATILLDCIAAGNDECAESIEYSILSLNHDATVEETETEIDYILDRFSEASGRGTGE